MKLKYILKLEDKVVSFQVLEMAECMRKTFRKTASNNITIVSGANPELRPYSMVFLWGSNRRYDTLVPTLTFESSEKATEYYNKIKFALEETFGKPSTWVVTPRRTELGKV